MHHHRRWSSQHSLVRCRELDKRMNRVRRVGKPANVGAMPRPQPSMHAAVQTAGTPKIASSWVGQGRAGQGKAKPRKGEVSEARFVFLGFFSPASHERRCKCSGATLQPLNLGYSTCQ
ncbi:hypothetical protein L1887_58681 [Cichorium endivia]|nr:hypothetical protein L1887_58681 [Cichorium endivia]